MFQMKKVIDTVAVNKTFPSRFCNTTVVWKYRIHIHTVLFACLKHTSAELRNESYHSRMEVAQIIIINRCFLAMHKGLVMSACSHSSGDQLGFDKSELYILTSQ